VNHVSLVATVTLGGQTLTRLMLTTTDLPFKSEELAIPRRTFAAYRTARGYMTAANMVFYLSHIVVPYVMFLRVTRQEPALMVYLVMDNDGEKEKSRKIPLHLVSIRLTVPKLEDFRFASIHSLRSSPSAPA
jgi:hypothetical protein